MRNTATEWILALTVAVFLALFAKSHITLAGNEASRLATVDSLVEDHSFAIDSSVFRTVDMVRIGEHDYSDKPPLLSLYLALIYSPLRAFLGMSFRNPSSSGTAIRLLTILGIVPFASGLAVLVCRRLRILGFGIWTGGVLALLSIASTWLFTYGTTVSNHVPAAFLFTSVYLVMSAAALTMKRCIAGGVLAGVLLNIEVVSGLVAGIAVCGCLVLFTRRLAWIIGFAIPVVLFAGIYAGLNVLSHGSVLPGYLVPYGYERVGGFHQQSPAALTPPTNLAAYAWNVLLGNRGVFSYMPALLFCLWPVFEAIWRGKRTRYDIVRRTHGIPEGALAIGFVLLLFAVYGLMTGDYGGWAYGFRYFVPALPLLFVYACVAMRQMVNRAGTRLAAAPCIALLAVGVATSAVGAWNPWTVCFEGAITEAHLRAGCRGAFLDDHARNTFLANAFCIAVDYASPSADLLARASLGTLDADDPIAQMYIERAFQNLGRPPREHWSQVLKTNDNALPAGKQALAEPGRSMVQAYASSHTPQKEEMAGGDE
jgi:hypothetical protein